MTIEYNEDHIDTGPANYYVEKGLTGTVTAAASGKTLTGAGTLFETELKVGQTCFVKDKTSGVETEVVIDEITSDTAATTVVGVDAVALSTMTALYNVGGIKDGIDVNIETSTYEKTIDQMGSTPIGDSINGRKVNLTVGLAELSPENWNRVIADQVGLKQSGGKNLFRVTPSVGLDLFDIGVKHRIIPIVGQSETTDLDKILTFWHVSPAAGTIGLKIAPDTPRPLKANFKAYPDPTTNEFFYMGDRSIA